MDVGCEVGLYRIIPFSACMILHIPKLDPDPDVGNRLYGKIIQNYPIFRLPENRVMM
jgi:hypothetical protein